MKAILLVVLAVTITACARGGSDYDPGGMAQDAYAQQTADCHSEARLTQHQQGYGGLAGIAGTIETYNAAYDLCMRAKGFKRL